MDSEYFINNPTDISTIVMAEVNLSGGKENEVVVAYNVTNDNILVDNNGVKFSSIDWAGFAQSMQDYCKDSMKY